MDDNILTQRSLTDAKSTCERDLEKLDAINIIDFSDLSIGKRPVHFVPWKSDIALFEHLTK